MTAWDEGGNRLGIVVPVLDDEIDALAALLPQLSALRLRGARLVLAHGGGRDATRAQLQSLAQAAGALYVACPRGRAVQMNAGATALLLADAQVSALWFLPVESSIPEHADRLIAQALQAHAWGHFDVRIRGRSHWLPLLARLMSWRSRLTGIATGEQGLFMRRAMFERTGGFAQIALMEDIDISRRLKRLAPPACVRAELGASGRFWDEHGPLRTLLLMAVLRWRYWFGASPDALLRRYRRHQARPVPVGGGSR